jgi:hypothetical protein
MGVAGKLQLLHMSSSRFVIWLGTESNVGLWPISVVQLSMAGCRSK